jgi:hypothetical protein
VPSRGISSVARNERQNFTPGFPRMAGGLSVFNRIKHDIEAIMKKAVNSNMASRGGFLVSDGALRRKNDRNKYTYTTKKQTRSIQRKKKKPEWDVSINNYFLSQTFQPLSL